VQQTPAQPGSPAATTQPAPYAVPVSSIPRTADEVNATRIKIEDLKTQLQDFAERRNSVASQLRRADIDARPGYQGRLANLDENINLLQNQIAQSSLALAQAPAPAVVAATVLAGGVSFPASGVARTVVPMMLAFSVVIVSLTFARMVWRRRSARPALAADPAGSQRLDQIQQSVDAIALEVERISEGQRFVTKVLADRENVALPR
jgi:Flp pilus assembly protein TadB